MPREMGRLTWVASTLLALAGVSSSSYGGTGIRLRQAVAPSNPGGQHSPRCMCPGRGEQPDDEEPAKDLYRYRYIRAEPIPGEVEVVTIDVGLANRVQSDNATLAANIARLLRVPKSRVQLLPWSWATPSNSQASQIALLQDSEDAVRCNCQAQTLLAAGRGRIRAPPSGMSAPAPRWPSHIHPDYRVMTVKEYEEMMAADADAASGSPHLDGMTPSGLRGPAPAPAAMVRSGRVQLLTRDPCLVQDLHDFTKEFRHDIADALDVPVEQVIIDRPVVRGSVGFVQVGDGSLGVSLLAVQSCHKGHQLLAVQQVQQAQQAQGPPAPAPAPADWLAGAPVPGPAQPVYIAGAPGFASAGLAGAGPAPGLAGAGPAGAGPAPGPAVVTFVAATTQMLAATPAGSTVLPVADTTGFAIGDRILIESTGGSEVNVIKGFSSIILETPLIYTHPAGTTIQKLPPNEPAGLQPFQAPAPAPAPSGPPPEANRAWIASWGVRFLPPNSDLTAEQFLLEVNTPGSKLSHLFPKTLARVPGLDPKFNATVNTLHEIRLPPPLDTAVGFRLPGPSDLKKVHTASTMPSVSGHFAKPRVVADEKHVEESLHTGKFVSYNLDLANAKFVKSAYVYDEVLHDVNKMKPPKIKSWYEAPNDDIPSESPYDGSWWSLLERSSSKHQEEPTAPVSRPSLRH